jgi:hypothetical protein
MQITKTAPHRGWDSLGHGIHICGIFSDKAQEFQSVLPFFRGGARKSEKCMYLYDEEAPRVIYEEFGVPIDDKENLFEKGQLEMHYFKNVYLRDGTFDPDGVIATFRQTVLATLHEGYTGFRAVGEMSGILDSATPLERYIEYENKLNNFYPLNKVTGICQFDENRFSEEFLGEMVRAHPYIILYGKLYQNRHFYTKAISDQKTLEKALEKDYREMVSTLQEEEPLLA